MGVCNVTPDSFSDGGRYLGVEAARARVDELLAEGADFIDVGGESTRPGAAPVPAGEQLSRILDVVRYAVERGACVSVDTTLPEVAAACLDVGACVVNDVSCLRDDELAKVTAASGAALILMHSRGTQEKMRGFSEYPDDAYGDVVEDVKHEWLQAAARALRAGVPKAALVMDPGLGFAKNARQSMELLRRLDELEQALSVPIAIGASRKSFLTLVDPQAAPEQRLGASVMATVHARLCSVDIVRVHDVRASAQGIDFMRAMSPTEP